MGTAHHEIAGEDLAEALIKISLDESDECGRHVLLYRCLWLKTGFYFFRRYRECCDLEHFWVALLRPEQDRHHNEPLL